MCRWNGTIAATRPASIRSRYTPGDLITSSDRIGSCATCMRAWCSYLRRGADVAFCPNCGEPLDGSLRVVADVDDAAVKIARINADRDIEVARISASLGRAELATEEVVAELETAVAPAVAAGEAAVLGAVLGAQGDAEPEPEAEPVIVNDGPEVAVVEDDAPPPAAEVEGSEPPAPEH